MGKRFLLFVGDDYYPRGAWRDFKGAFSSIDEAWNHLRAVYTHDNHYQAPDWIQIVDVSQLKVVWEGEKDDDFCRNGYEGGTFFKQIPVVEGD